MIISNLIKKIKSTIINEGETLIYILIIILVGISSFYLGKLSNLAQKTTKNDISYSIIDSVEEDKIKTVLKSKNYGASKNGKTYYPVSCGGFSRIKEENIVWFETREEAEKSGFVMSSSCKN